MIAAVVVTGPDQHRPVAEQPLHHVRRDAGLRRGLRRRGARLAALHQPGATGTRR